MGSTIDLSPVWPLLGMTSALTSALTPMAARTILPSADQPVTRNLKAGLQIPFPPILGNVIDQRSKSATSRWEYCPWPAIM